MKGFERSDFCLSLCGLNCTLCPMHLGGHCPGCGGGAGNQSCGIARCSLEHGGLEYCSRCAEYPCAKYEGFDEFDSFITHRNRDANLRRAEKIGLDAYSAEQVERAEILQTLLTNFNDGRKKTLYCLGVNLLRLDDLREIMAHLEPSMPLKERTAQAAGLFQSAAEKQNIELKLRKKKK